MVTYAQTVRRGLPRRPGGEPWPPAASAPVVAVPPPVVALPPADAAPPSDAPQIAPAEQSAPTAVAGASPLTLRRGLPRVPGGEPWPPAVSPPVVAVPPAEAVAAASDARQIASAEQRIVAETVEASEPSEVEPVTARASPPGTHPLRRGLPRVHGGDAWPPAGLAPASSAPPTETVPLASEERQKETGEQVTSGTTSTPSADLSIPLPFTRTVWPGTAARTRTQPRTEPKRYGPFTRLQWAGAVIVGGGGLLFAAGMAVLAVRFVLSLEPMQEFVAAYPGEYHLPEGAPVGIPAWLGWQHFFNVFLIVLIIRSGLRVRSEKRPTAFWSPRNNGRRKISLTLWFHQALDLLWIVNGVVFVVLLFATGQWMRIIPTSWEVFPNAISAGLQYVSLDWPTENGWVNYNSLQQLAYFTTVFVAAPLAIATGVRMSGIWPKNAQTLNRLYPVEWARAVHFPVMLYFVVFIAIHVFLVFATGALRNLNHMYAAQGSVDPNAYADNWTGFWFFVASLVVIAAAWIAARPLVLAPIARLFGKVSGR